MLMTASAHCMVILPDSIVAVVPVWSVFVEDGSVVVIVDIVT